MKNPKNKIPLLLLVFDDFNEILLRRMKDGPEESWKE